LIYLELAFPGSHRRICYLFLTPGFMIIAYLYAENLSNE
jgi:hypothetical protein